MIRKILLFLFYDIKIVKIFCKSKAFLLIFSRKASVLRTQKKVAKAEEKVVIASRIFLGRSVCLNPERVSQLLLLKIKIGNTLFEIAWCNHFGGN